MPMEHTVKAFDEEMTELRGLIAQMGGLAEKALDDALTSLVRRDATLAGEVVARDKDIDELEMRVEKRAIETIALRAPMANDLRELIAALKIVGVIERIGDYAKNIAKRAPMITQQSNFEPISLLPAMGQIASEMVHEALNAYASQSPEAAVAVVERDRMVDDFYNSIFRTLLTYMAENPRSISGATHLMFVAKNIERIGDHATNIAEMVYYAATGSHMPERERGSDALKPSGA